MPASLRNSEAPADNNMADQGSWEGPDQHMADAHAATSEMWGLIPPRFETSLR